MATRSGTADLRAGIAALGSRLGSIRLRRREQGRVVAGVCSGIAATLDIDVTLVRLVFGLLALAGGCGIVLYLAAWILVPDEAGNRPRSQLEGAVLLLVAIGLAVRGLGLADSLVWPALVLAIGIALVSGVDVPFLAAPAAVRTGVGIAFVVAGVALAVGYGRPFAGGSLVAPAPSSSCSSSSSARGRGASPASVTPSGRRASVRRSGPTWQPASTTPCCRRWHSCSAPPTTRGAWLRSPAGRSGSCAAGSTAGGSEGTELLGRALEDALADVEELHGVRVELVQTGDAALDDRLRALVLATREAVSNAAVHAGVRDVAVFADVSDDEAVVYVRDRGSGFDRKSVPAADRRGIADSIEARLARHGGKATIRSAHGEGTEVELRLPLEAS